MAALPPQALRELRERLLAYRGAPLPPEGRLMELADQTVSTLEREEADYRPAADDGTPGGLLDFTRSPALPAIIVPDLHARPDFLPLLLDSSLAAPTVLDALNEGGATVVCVGDGVHTETPDRAWPRWQESYRRWLAGQADSPSMQAEMQETWATMAVVMELKNAFPRSFHFLKGNHENILNAEGGGDHAFRKFVQEGEMVRDFMLCQYSAATLHVISCFEHALPIVAAFPTFAVSHAEPAAVVPRDAIINCRRHPDVILNFTWTANGEAAPGSVEGQHQLLCPRGEPLWLGGHRPVPGRYALRQGGAYVQIHNPEQMNVAVVADGAHFVPGRDIVSVRGEEHGCKGGH